MSELIDFGGKVSGPVSGIYENRIGGRVAILGYSPWTWLQNLSKSTQVKSLCRWLSRDTLPAYVSSFHKIALWCRRDADGQPVIPLINASLDAVSGVRLHVRDAGPFHLMRLDGRTEDIVTISSDGDYTVLELPVLAPWEMVLVESNLRC